MSVRNGFALLLALSGLLFLAACGSSGGGITNPVAPPSGNFSTSNLNGTYVFSVSGTDINYGTPYAMVGTLTANGSGGITGGTIDINDVAFFEDYPTPLTAADLPIGNASYGVSVDGRGKITFTTSNAVFPTVTLDFVLSSSSHGLVTEFDAYGTGSGTIDLESAGTTPAGAYAFSFSGGSFSQSPIPYAAVGNFTLGAGGAISTGLVDSNEGGLIPSLQGSLTGSVIISSTAPSTTLTFPQFGTLTFDVFPIDATHLKFIEMDTTATLSGDAYSQTSTALPTGTLPFTLEGSTNEGAPFTAGGFMVTDGAGNITSASSEDIAEYTSAGTTSVLSAASFTGTYAALPTGSGRYALSFPSSSGFVPAGSTFAAYPSSGGVLLLEADSLGITTGAAYGPQSTPVPTFAAAQGYALNLTGENVNVGEVDNIAEFTTSSSGDTITGIIDENTEAGNGPTYGLALTEGTYTLPDTNGRGQISATADTINGGLLLNYYTVDGTTFPFIETDGGQVATGVFVQQNPTAAAGAVAMHSHMFVPRPLFHSRAARQKKN
ncbi:MAG: hypothetical protein WAM04_16020 [Candidatus Sulfotelmatobacter sp.]